MTMRQGVYLSTEMPEGTGVERIQLVDRASTQGLRGNGLRKN